MTGIALWLKFAGKQRCRSEALDQHYYQAMLDLKLSFLEHGLT